MSAPLGASGAQELYDLTSENCQVKPFGVLTWDAGELSLALKIAPSSVRDYFTDDGRVAFLVVIEALP